MHRIFLLLAVFLAAASLALSNVSAALQVKPAVVKTIIDPFTFQVAMGKKTEQVRLLNLLPIEAQHPEQLSLLEGFTLEKDLEQLKGKTIYLEFDSQSRDNSNRLLAYVWLKKPKTANLDEMAAQMLNARMLTLGYAEWSPANPSYKYLSELLTMETDAFLAKRGIWQQQ